MSANAGEIDRERYQRLIGRLIYLSHSHSVSMISHYMHDPSNDHMDTVFHILRYLKSAPRKSLIFKNNRYMNIKGYCDSDWISCQDNRRSTFGYYIFVRGNLIS
jgi:hypothetical protein